MQRPAPDRPVWMSEMDKPLELVARMVSGAAARSAWAKTARFRSRSSATHSCACSAPARASSIVPTAWTDSDPSAKAFGSASPLSTRKRPISKARAHAERARLGVLSKTRTSRAWAANSAVQLAPVRPAPRTATGLCDTTGSGTRCSLLHRILEDVVHGWLSAPSKLASLRSAPAPSGLHLRTYHEAGRSWRTAASRPWLRVAAKSSFAVEMGLRLKFSTRTPSTFSVMNAGRVGPVSYTHLRAHETKANLVCRLLL